MKKLRMLTASMAVVAFAGLDGGIQAARPLMFPSGDAAVAIPPPVERVLRLAREAAGSERLRISEVSAIGKRTRYRDGRPGQGTADGFQFTLRIPSFFEWRTEAVTFTVSGTAFKSTRETDLEIRETAERNTRWRSVEMGLIFLNRLPDTLSLRARDLGHSSIDGMSGRALEFSSGASSIVMIFNEQTHLPVAQILGASGPGVPRRVHRLGDFRPVAGVLVPHRIEERFAGNLAVVALESVKLVVSRGR